jgi:hypothetical protein
MLRPRTFCFQDILSYMGKGTSELIYAHGISPVKINRYLCLSNNSALTRVFQEPQIQILAPAPAPAPDIFIRYLENYLLI